MRTTRNSGLAFTNIALQIFRIRPFEWTEEYFPFHYHSSTTNIVAAPSASKKFILHIRMFRKNVYKKSWMQYFWKVSLIILAKFPLQPTFGFSVSLFQIKYAVHKTIWDKRLLTISIMASEKHLSSCIIFCCRRATWMGMHSLLCCKALILVTSMCTFDIDSSFLLSYELCETSVICKIECNG